MEEQIFFRKEGGEEPTIIFIHGWLGSNKSWKKIEENLQLENQKIFPDQRCHGKSFCKPYNVKDLADDLIEIIMKEEIQDPILIGHSLGGMTALSYIANYESISGLILLGTPSSTPKPESKNFDFYISQLDSLKREEWAESIASNYTEDYELREMAKRELVEEEEKRLRIGLQAMKNFDVTEKIHQNDFPALVIAGERDQAVTIEKSKETANIVEANFEVLDCGHLMNWSRPEKIADMVEDFVENEVN